MKLDRNINPDGQGKYALLNLRKIRAIVANPDRGGDAADIQEALSHLKVLGLIHWGNEGSGEQFFVMKYKDLFTVKALEAYANEALSVNTNVPGLREELIEYGNEIMKEAEAARQCGCKLPD